jgi:hypothetical protein
MRLLPSNEGAGRWTSSDTNSPSRPQEPREIRGLPLPKFTELTDDIHRRIGAFLSFDDLVQLSLSRKKLFTAYKPVLAEKLRVSLISPILRVLPLSPPIKTMPTIFGSRIPRTKFDLRVAVVPRSSIMLTLCSSVKNADLQSCGINGQLERL